MAPRMRFGSIVLRDRSVGVGGVNGASVELAALFMEVPPRNAVLHRDDRRLVVAEWREAWGDCRHLVRLDCEDDDLLHAGVGRVLVRGHGACHDLEPVLADHAHSVLANGVEVGAARDERHVFTGGGEPSAHVSADRTSADDRDLHASAPRSCVLTEASCRAFA